MVLHGIRAYLHDVSASGASIAAIQFSNSLQVWDMTRRVPQREDRRRRVLREEPRPTKPGKPKRRSSSSSDGKLYGDGALAANQPRITDYLPQRKMALFSFFALGVGAIAATESLYVAHQVVLSRFPHVDTTWLGLTGPNTLVTHLAATMLAVAAVMAVLVTRLRRHKVNDYKGRYRLWYLVVILLIVSSVDVITLGHRAFRDVMVAVVESPPWQNTAVWWILGYSVVGGLVALRVMIDARRCKMAVLAWFMAAACLGGSAVLYLGVWQLPAFETQLMSQTALFLSGLHLTVFGLALFGRHIMLAAGTSIRTNTKTKRTASGETKKTGLIRLPGFTKRKKTQPRKTRSAETPSTDSEEFEDVQDEVELELLTNPDLTKAERRKLRKQMKRREREAA